MKQEYISYAMLLEPLGDLIIETSNCIKIGNLDSLKEAIQRYEYAISSLEELKPPAIINTEHNLLTKSLRNWLTATKQGAGLKSGNIVENALIGQKQAELDIQKHINEIVLKFQNN